MDDDPSCQETAVRRPTPQRVQVPNIYGLWSQIPLRVWVFDPETSNIEYLEFLGPVPRGWAHFSGQQSGTGSFLASYGSGLPSPFLKLL